MSEDIIESENKIYIGKAASYKKYKKGYVPYGAIARVTEHFTNALTMKNKYRINDCPRLYSAIRTHGSNNFTYSVLKIVPIDILDITEEEYILLYNSYKIDYGYNIFIGNKKPLDPILRAEYEQRKAISNVNRAINGNMKRMEHSKNLPPNINYRKPTSIGKNGTTIGDGYFVQIKINGKLFNKAFISKNLSLDEKLILAQDYLNKIKQENQ